MILVDTSILVRYFRTGSPAILEIFQSADCGVCGVTRAEILHGARSAEDAAKLRAALEPFTAVPIDERIWDRLGDHLALLRRHGLPLPFQDALLATVALEQDTDLWSDDAHFKLMRTVLPSLRLFEGPR